MNRRARRPRITEGRATLQKFDVSHAPRADRLGMHELQDGTGRLMMCLIQADGKILGYLTMQTEQIEKLGTAMVNHAQAQGRRIILAGG